jgi:hypothetical protein
LIAPPIERTGPNVYREVAIVSSRIAAEGEGSTMSESEPKNRLVRIPDFRFAVYASPGFEKQAAQAAGRCAQAYAFMSELFSVAPKIRLQGLAEEDWTSHTMGQPYGMPHYQFSSQSITIAVEPSYLWRRSVEVIRDSSPEDYRELQSVYGEFRDDPDLSEFFNLLVVHELGHAMHHQGRCVFPRFWLQEFFCNLCLHAYIVSREPEKLPFLETYPHLLTRADPSQFEHRTLGDFEMFYSNMAPQNYAWYQTQLTVAAKRVFEVGGVDVLKRLWHAFHVPDSLLQEKLRGEVHPIVADIMVGWPSADGG